MTVTKAAVATDTAVGAGTTTTEDPLSTGATVPEVDHLLLSRLVPPTGLNLSSFLKFLLSSRSEGFFPFRLQLAIIELTEGNSFVDVASVPEKI